MSGQSESKKDSKTPLEQIDEILQSYEKKMRIELTHKYDINSYLNMDRAQLEALTPHQCLEIATYLSSYLIQLQREINRETARVNWCTANINLIVGQYLKDYTDFKYEAKVLQIINDSSTARKLELIKIAAQTRIDSLAYIPNRIDFFIKTLTSLGNAKQYKV